METLYGLTEEELEYPLKDVIVAYPQMWVDNWLWEFVKE
jgi:hypothetical protein